jgi:hypothetical protein
MNGSSTKIKISSLEGLYKVSYQIPESWNRAAGLLSRKRKALENHLRRIRAEWNRKNK